MITSPELTQLCRHAIENGFKDFASKNIEVTSIWASHNGAGTISLKLYANRSLVYSDQFSMFDMEWLHSLFGTDPMRTLEFRGQHSNAPKLITQGGCSNAQYRAMMAVIDKDPIGYYYKAVFNA